MSSGTEHAQECIWFYCIFDRSRVYLPDFGANFNRFIQKPISYIQTNKTLILGNLKTGIEKYLNNVKVNDIDIGYTNDNRKYYSLRIVYSYMDSDLKTNNVIFV